MAIEGDVEVQKFLNQLEKSFVTRLLKSTAISCVEFTDEPEMF